MVSMLNQAAVEALCAATYFEDFLDCLDCLPDDLQKSVTKLREIDCKFQEYLSDLRQNKETYLQTADGQRRQISLSKIQRALVKCQEIGDEKLQIVATIAEQIENRAKQMEQNLENLDPSVATDVRSVVSHPSTSNSKTRSEHKLAKSESESNLLSKKRTRRRVPQPTPASTTPTVVAPPKEEKKVIEEEEKPPKKKRKKKSAAASSTGKQKSADKSADVDIPDDEFDIDPDEPLYCLCNRVSYGEMIGCDNEQCTIEWFHFGCVSLTTKPKGRWYCPQCRGDKATVKRADLK